MDDESCPSVAFKADVDVRQMVELLHQDGQAEKNEDRHKQLQPHTDLLEADPHMACIPAAVHHVGQ